MRARRPQHAARSAIAFAGGALLIAAASACGSSGTSASSAGAHSTAKSAPAVAAAQKAVVAAERAPTKVQLSPLRSRPPSGKTVVFLDPGVVQATYNAKGIEQAAAALGWHYRQIALDQSTPSSVVSALNQALQYHPAAVILIGLPESEWASVLPAYKRAGTSIVTLEDITALSGPVIANVAGASFFRNQAQILANWFIADSHGAGDVLMARFDGLTILKLLADDFIADVHRGCPGCTVSSVNQSLAVADSNQGNNVVVSKLRTSPNTKYLFITDGPFLSGITSSLSAASLSHIKIFSAGGDTTNETDVKSGVEAATLPVALTYAGWLGVDAELRHLEATSTASDNQGLPIQLLTKSASFTPSDSFNVPANFPAQFKSLWKVG